MLILYLYDTFIRYIVYTEGYIPGLLSNMSNTLEFYLDPPIAFLGIRCKLPCSYEVCHCFERFIAGMGMRIANQLELILHFDNSPSSRTSEIIFFPA